jgi:hypothetical protein
VRPAWTAAQSLRRPIAKGAQLGDVGGLHHLDPGSEVLATAFAEQPGEGLGQLGGCRDDWRARADALEAVTVTRVQSIGVAQDPLA